MALSRENRLIAPCGMNCALCIGHLRAKNKCTGCNTDSLGKPNYCVNCIIVHCPERSATESGFCYECPSFPCKRMKTLDARYRKNYGMSMIENLEKIQSVGLEQFISMEIERWACPKCGSQFCVHRDKCLACGEVNTAYKKKKSSHP